MSDKYTEGVRLLKELISCYNGISVEELEKQVKNDVLKLFELNEDIHKIHMCNMFQCKELLSKLKLIIARLDSLDPLVPIKQKNIQELLLAREILEQGIIISVRDKDLKAFTIYTSQLFVYYFDYKNIIPKSKKQNAILGTYLLYLLASNSVGDFHMTLEIISIEDQNDPYIKYVLELEQHIMDGYFNRVLTRKSEIPLYLYSLFMDKLHDTIRFKLIDCIFASSTSISIKHACELLCFCHSVELMEFLNLYNDTKEEQKETLPPYEIIEGYIVFNNQIQTTQDIPSLEIYNNTIGYATELERIV